MKTIITSILLCISLILILGTNAIAKESPVIFIQGDPYYINHLPDPVNLRSGNLYIPLTDFDIKASNIDLKFERFYNSFHSKKDGPLGFGWRHNYMTKIIAKGPRELRVEESDGFITSFKLTREYKIRLAEKIYEVRKQFDESKSLAKTEEYYRKFKEKMLAKDSYLLEMKDNYLKGRKDIPFGSYYSNMRKGQILSQTEDGFIRRYKDGKKELFDKDGKLTKIEDRNSNYLEISYKAEKLSKIADSQGLALNFVYTIDKRISSITDAVGRTFNYSFDKNGNLTETVGFMKEKEIFNYDTKHKITQIKLANGADVKISYDKYSRVSNQTGPGSKTANYSYGKKGNVVYGEVTDSGGNKRTFKFFQKEGKTVEISPDQSIKTTFHDTKTGKLSKSLDENGFTTNYIYNDDGELSKIINPLGLTIKYTYDSSGQITSISEGKAVTSFTYDKRGNLLTKTLPSKDKLAYRYDAKGNLIKIIYASGSSVSMVYDRFGNITELIDANGNSTKFKSDKLGRIFEQTDAKGSKIKLTYDLAGNISSLTDEMNRTIKIKYNFDNQPVEITDARGAKTEYTYNEMGLLETETNPKGLIKKYAYDSTGKLIAMTDFDGNRHVNKYDRMGRLIKSIKPGGNTQEYGYEQNGKLVYYSENNNSKFFYLYDPMGRLVRIVFPDKTNETFNYGYNYIVMEDRRKNKHRYTFDIMDRVTEIQEPHGKKTQYSYDHASRLIEEKSNTGKHFNYVYDASGKLAEVKRNKRTYYKNTYDSKGNIVEMVDGKGGKSKFKYDPSGNLISASGPLGEKVNLSYNVQGDVTSLQNESGAKEKYRYNSAGQLVSRIYPDSSVESYTYDKLGRIVKRTLPDSSILTYEYDKSSKLLKVTDGKLTLAEFSYDKNGRLVNAKNENAAFSFKYNSLGKLIQEKDLNRNKTLSYKYDKFGNLQSIYDGKKRLVSYKYNKFNLLTGIIDNLKRKYRFKYNLEKQIKKIGYPNGVVTSYEYNDLMRVKKISTSKQGKQIYSAAYEYDDFGNVLKETTLDGYTNYLYDRMGRITKVDYGKNALYSYSYDAAGNRISEKIPGINRNYKYDKMGRLINAGDMNFKYDQLGNLTAKSTKDSKISFKYSKDGLLEDVVKNGKSFLKIKYDPFGRKYSQTKNGEKSYFRYYGFVNLKQESEQGKTLKSFVYRPDILHIDTPFAIADGSKKVYPIQNAGGSIVKITSAKGAVTESIKYEPFGKPIISKDKNSISGRLAFASRPYYKEVGLSDFRYRYYDTDIGRFISKDPLTPLSSLNGYTYPGNNPMKYSDPLGLVSWGSKSPSPGASGPGRGGSSDSGTPGPGRGGGAGTGGDIGGPVNRPTNPPTSPTTPPGLLGQGKPDYWKLILYGAVVPWGVKQLGDILTIDFSNVTGNITGRHLGATNPLSNVLVGASQKVLGFSDGFLGNVLGIGVHKDLSKVKTQNLKNDLALLSNEDFMKKYPNVEIMSGTTGWIVVKDQTGIIKEIKCSDLARIAASQNTERKTWQQQGYDARMTNTYGNDPRQSGQYQAYQDQRSGGNQNYNYNSNYQNQQYYQQYQNQQQNYNQGQRQGTPQIPGTQGGQYNTSGPPRPPR